MTLSAPRVVYDCNIFAQALINLNGPAAGCVRKARQSAVFLFASAVVLEEIRQLHQKIPAKYGVTAEQTDQLATSVASFATIISDVPELYRHPIDPDDSHYVNQAAKVSARLVVSRDRQRRRDGGDKRSPARDRNSGRQLILLPVRSYHSSRIGPQMRIWKADSWFPARRCRERKPGGGQ